MKELTEMEICKKIAKIEGHIFAKWSEKQNKPAILKEGSTNQGRVYNPLTNDALCFQLMIKHEVIREWEPYDFVGWNYHSQKDKNPERITERTYFGKGEETPDISPNKAICLAIIKAHKTITNK